MLPSVKIEREAGNAIMCPACKTNKSIWVHSQGFGSKRAFQALACDNCGMRWVNVYNRTSFQIVGWDSINA